MSVVFIVLPLALLIAAAALAAFIWAARSGQLDDLDTPGLRVLYDDEDEAR
jgi:cbb3-type cytochrome oxidase maturation protein